MFLKCSSLKWRAMASGITFLRNIDRGMRKSFSLRRTSGLLAIVKNKGNNLRLYSFGSNLEL